MNNLTQWRIVDWANNEVNTGGETFDSFDDAWTWIDTFIPSENNAHDDYFVVETKGTENEK